MQEASLTRTNLRTPKAAAIAGMLFSLLTVAAFWLFWISVPADPQDVGSWLSENSKTVALGLNLIPFAGIAFLWFIGVLRDRLGELEDRFFATVFFGSGLLFLGTLFTAAAVIGALLIAFVAQPKADRWPSLSRSLSELISTTVSHSLFFAHCSDTPSAIAPPLAVAADTQMT